MSDKITLTGMVLSALPVGEYDKRIVLLTKERGKISGFAKGARRQNSPMMAASNPFCYGSFECFEGKSSYNIYQAQIDQYFEKLAFDFENAYYGMYFLEFADYYARENNDERELLKLLYVTLKALEHGRVNRRLIRYIYEFRAMMINGEYPESFSCVGCGTSEQLCGYSDEKNGVLCQRCLSHMRGKRILESTIYTMQYVTAAPLEKLYTFLLTPEVEKEFISMQEKFRRKMIDRNFKTLEILNTLKI